MPGSGARRTSLLWYHTGVQSRWPPEAARTTSNSEHPDGARRETSRTQEAEPRDREAPLGVRPPAAGTARRRRREGRGRLRPEGSERLERIAGDDGRAAGRMRPRGRSSATLPNKRFAARCPATTRSSRFGTSTRPTSSGWSTGKLSTVTHGLTVQPIDWAAKLDNLGAEEFAPPFAITELMPFPPGRADREQPVDDGAKPGTRAEQHHLARRQHLRRALRPEHLRREMLRGAGDRLPGSTGPDSSRSPQTCGISTAGS